jgi:hypothetical protein
MEITEGGEVDEMDVSSCNPLFDLRVNTYVLSKTLNCSLKVKGVISEQPEEFSKASRFSTGLFLQFGKVQQVDQCRKFVFLKLHPFYLSFLHVVGHCPEVGLTRIHTKYREQLVFRAFNAK